MTYRKKKKKLSKEKQRKQSIKDKLLVRRTKLRELAREKRNLEAAKKHFEPKLFPIRKDREKPQPNPILESVEPIEKSEDPAHKEWVMRQLERNQDILNALEEELEREEAMRNEVKKSLEEKGAHTLKEQMDLIGQEAEKTAGIQKKNGPKFTGKSKVQMKTNDDVNIDKTSKK